MSFYFYQSNSLESLIDYFAQNYRQSISNPFDKEIIMVQTSGMEKWIALKTTEKKDIFANNDILFPKDLISKIYRTVLDYDDLQVAYNKDELIWKIYSVLPNLTDRNEFQQIKEYLKNDIKNLKLYQLSLKIADLFDQYQIYRPDMVRDWDKGNFWFGVKTNKNDNKFLWQAILWQEIFKESQNHSALLYYKFIENLKDEFYIEKLKRNFKSINIFGVYILPQIYLDIFAIISKYIRVNYYLLNPCKEYWLDIKSKKEIKKIEKKTSKDSNELYFEEGNELLSSLGKIGRDFNNMVFNLPNFDEIIFEDNLFVDIDETSTLKIIQSDILNLKKATDETVPYLNDESIEIHSCHNKMREIEVLYDNILNILNNDKSLSLSDIIVISPEIISYSPYIKAVFDNAEIKIDYKIADIPNTKEFSLLEAFKKTVQVLTGKFKSSEVVSLLSYEFIRKKFDIELKDVEKIEKWVDEVGIRWGINKEQIEYSCDEDFFTFERGVSRLLLGYSMNSDDLHKVENEYIFDNFDETDAILLGKFLDFINVLLDFYKSLNKKHSIKTWVEILNSFIENLFYQNFPFDESYIFIQKTFSNLGEYSNDENICSIEVIISHISNKFQENISTENFISGGLTFSAMVPMRSIPFKIICMIGMNDGTFPRQKQNMEFDIISQFPMQGDRNPRDTDKYLFLETIISATEKLYISYIGQDSNDNTDIPPSVLVSELINYIDIKFNLDDIEKEKLVKKHKLQAFNYQYFAEDSSLFSFSNKNKQIAEFSYSGEEKEYSFFNNLTDKEIKIDTLKIEDIISFYTHPVRYFYNKQLLIYLDDKDDFLKDNETFTLNNLESFIIKDSLFNIDEFKDFEELANYYKSVAAFPLCNVGKYYKEKFIGEYLEFYKNFEKYAIEKQTNESKSFDIENVKLQVNFKNIYKDYQVFVKPNKLKAKFEIASWVWHLALQYYKKLPTIIITEDFVIKYKNVKEPLKYLKTLIDYYKVGIQRPLPFFPSFSYSENSHDIDKLAINWFKEKYDGYSDVYLNHLYNEKFPFDEEFFELVDKIINPIVENKEVLWQKQKS